jgi:hypothetical protein
MVTVHADSIKIDSEKENLFTMERRQSTESQPSLLEI